MLCRPSWGVALTATTRGYVDRALLVGMTLALAWLALASGREVLAFAFQQQLSTLAATTLLLVPAALFWASPPGARATKIAMRTFLAYGAGFVVAGISVLAWMGARKMGEEAGSFLPLALSFLALGLWGASVLLSLSTFGLRGEREGACDKGCTTRPCTRQGAKVCPLRGQSLRGALQVKAGVRWA